MKPGDPGFLDAGTSELEMSGFSDAFTAVGVTALREGNPWWSYLTDAQLREVTDASKVASWIPLHINTTAYWAWTRVLGGVPLCGSTHSSRDVARALFEDYARASNVQRARGMSVDALASRVAEAVEKGIEASATAPDRGACNFDMVHLPVGPTEAIARRTRAFDEALEGRGVSFSFSRTHGYCLHVPCDGQADQRTAAVEAAAAALADLGATVFYKLD